MFFYVQNNFCLFHLRVYRQLIHFLNKLITPLEIKIIHSNFDELDFIF